MKQSKTHHKWNLLDSYRPFNRTIYVDVFKCQACQRIIKGQRSELINPKSPILPNQKDFQLDWEWEKYLKIKDARKINCNQNKSTDGGKSN